MRIPVFHDDQHGTAIIVGAAILNGLKVVGKDLSSVKLRDFGCGCGGARVPGLLVKMGLPVEHITVTDIKGVVYRGRIEEMDPDKRTTPGTRRRARSTK
jgi:malate dehydrogenase (oxaloacetate-decarboxylating)(NADP+)